MPEDLGSNTPAEAEKDVCYIQDTLSSIETNTKKIHIKILERLKIASCPILLLSYLNMLNFSIFE